LLPRLAWRTAFAAGLVRGKMDKCTFGAVGPEANNLEAE
jgi:hypothetical protein